MSETRRTMGPEPSPVTRPEPWWTDRIDVLGIGITPTDLRSAVETGTRWISEREQRRIHFCNVHSVMEAQKDPALRRALNSADMAAPDGMPLVWLAHQAGYRTAGRVYGPDFMLAMCEAGVRCGWRHFFYGGGQGVAERLTDRLRTRIHDLQIAGVYTPPFRSAGEREAPEVLDRINASNADILWVGLGTPKQDFWLAHHRRMLRAPVIAGVGAAFDFHAGLIAQAPLWMQSRGLEWLFRLAHEPSRLWYRYLVYNPAFIVSLVLKRIVQNRDPSR